MQLRFTLRDKLLAFTVGIVALLMTVSLVLLDYWLTDQVKNDVRDNLDKTETVFLGFLQERGQWLLSQGLVVAADPRFYAPLDIRGADFKQQATTVLPEAKEFQSLLGSNLFVVTDRTGQTLARVELHLTSGSSLGSSQVTQVPAGAGAFYSTRLEGLDLAVGTVPVFHDDEVVGTLAVGFAMEEGEEEAGEEDQEILLADLTGIAQERELGSVLRAANGAAAADAVRELQRDFGSDLTALSDMNGAPLALYLREASSGEDLSGSPRIQQALQGLDGRHLLAEQGRLFQVAVVPAGSPDHVVGTLTTGFEIDDDLAHDLREMTHSEVSFALAGRVVASTLPEDAQKALEESVFSPSALAQFSAGPALEMTLKGETYLSLLGRLEGTDGVYLIQSSLDQATSFLTTLEQTLIFLGSFILLAAFLITSLGISRIARPIGALVEGTRRLATGDLDYRIEVESKDEMGELADSFNDMSAALAGSLEALSESEHLYRDLFDNAQDMVYTTDLEMNLTSVNKAGTKLTGYTQEELLGRSFYDLLSPEDAKTLKETEERLEPGESWPAFEAGLVCKDESQVTIEVVSRWMQREGHVVGVHGIGRDISQRRERERAAHRFREQLHQTEKLRALGEMSAGVAHNFNNLLTGIMGHAELISCDENAPQEVRQDAGKIVEWADSCAAVVRRIRTFGRPIDTLHKEKVDLRQLVHDTLELTRPKWETRPQREGTTVEISLDLEEVPIISSSAGAWEEILSNLIFNAVDAMPQGGAIKIATWQEGHRVALSVTDAGIGMDESTKRRVFEPFYTTKGPELGTGLGLSTVWGLVQSFGGTIDIGSVPGQGTSFTIRVPVDQEGVETRPRTETPRPVAGLRILVIEDEAAARETLFRLLSQHRVTTAESGEEGLALIDEDTYDLVISDWSMAGISGLEVAVEARRRAPESVIILTSGWELQGTAADESPDVDLLLQKPIGQRELYRILDEATQILMQRRSVGIADLASGG